MGMSGCRGRPPSRTCGAARDSVASPPPCDADAATSSSYVQASPLRSGGPRCSVKLALPTLALVTCAFVARAQDPPGAVGLAGAVLGDQGTAPRVVLDLDWEPKESRGFWKTLLRGRARAAEHNFFDLPFPLDSRRTASG